MSPRPKKIRYCEGEFNALTYRPVGLPVSGLKEIEPHRDELEAFRLCDAQGLTQEEAGEKIGVSRGTVQRIVTVARKKVATSLASGYAITFVEDEE